MKHAAALLLTLLLPALAAGESGHDVVEPPPSPIAEAALPVSFDDGRLGGPGGEALLAAARDAQFVLVGEDHGYAETPRITAAIARALAPDGPRYLLAEIGPIVARDMERLARSGDRAAWNDWFRESPFAAAFFWFEEELEMARAIAVLGGEAPVIWGVDQEFVLSPLRHFLDLRELAPDAATRERLDALIEAEREAFATILATRNPKGAPLALYGDGSDLAALRQAFAGNDAAIARVDAMEESRAIYALYGQGRGYDNNQVRAQLMKRLLRERLQAAPEGPAKARLIGKFGANHVMRGHSAMSVLDLGNHLAELAEWHGNRSFHLLVLPIGGHKNMALPFSGLAAERIPVDCASLGPYAPLCQAAGGVAGWRYVDLAALRPRLGAIAKHDRALVDLVLGFDAVLFVADATPATMLPGNRESLQPATD